MTRLPSATYGIVYLILRAQTGGRRPEDASIDAEQIADFSGSLLDSGTAGFCAEVLVQEGVAVRLPADPRQAGAYSIPALRTINDYELSLRATASTLKEILSWELN